MNIKSVRGVLAARYLYAAALALMLAACSGSFFHSIGGTVTGLLGTGLTSAVVLQNNGGDDLTVIADGPFKFSNTVKDRRNYNVTVLTQPAGQNCIVANGSGTATGDVSNVAVYCNNSTTRYAYVANSGSSTVSQYTVSAGGALSAMSTATVATDTTPYSVTVDPTGKYVYVANISSGTGTHPGTVSQYTIGAGGALTAMATPTVAAEINPASIAVALSGPYAYVANAGTATVPGSVSQYTIGTDGVLTAMVPASVAAETNPESVTIDPSGKYAYVANHGNSSVSQYNIGPSGALTAMTTASVTAGTNPNSVTIDPLGTYAYVANAGSNSVSQYKIGTDGALTALATATVAAGLNPASVTIVSTVNPAGKYAYVTNYGGSNVSQYTVGADGALTPMSTATVAAGANPASVTVDASKQFAYVANYGSNTVSQYIIGADGALMPLATATIATDSNPISVVTTK